jgi:hypothetical protein
LGDDAAPACWETGWRIAQLAGQGIATKAIAAVAIGRAQQDTFMHAFPSVDNGPSNAICRKTGFTLQERLISVSANHFMAATTGAWTCLLVSYRLHLNNPEQHSGSTSELYSAWRTTSPHRHSQMSELPPVHG